MESPSNLDNPLYGMGLKSQVPPILTLWFQFLLIFINPIQDTTCSWGNNFTASFNSLVKVYYKHKLPIQYQVVSKLFKQLKTNIIFQTIFCQTCNSTETQPSCNLNSITRTTSTTTVKIIIPNSEVF